jgi:quercetin dioxygenase-like cupin family protein
MEIWKDIPGYEGRYQASDLGRIKSLDRVNPAATGRGKNHTFKGRVLHHNLSPKGYHTLSLCGADGKIVGRRVHRLVAYCFLEPPKPEQDQVNHIDGDKNNNKATNLEWCDSTYNNREAVRLGLKKTGQDCPLSYSTCQKDMNGVVVGLYGSLGLASKATGIGISAISNCAHGKTKHAGGFLWEYIRAKQPEVHIKGWGAELWVVNNNLYCGKILKFNKGEKCSYHFHKLKDETFYLSVGKMIIRHSPNEDIDEADTFIMMPGDTFYVPPGLIHQMEALEDSELVEFSTQHFESDSYRIIKGD